MLTDDEEQMSVLWATRGSDMGNSSMSARLPSRRTPDGQELNNIGDCHHAHPRHHNLPKMSVIDALPYYDKEVDNIGKRLAVLGSSRWADQERPCAFASAQATRAEGD
jgi:hypothetical protein